MASTTRVRGFAPWKPQARTLPLIEAVLRVLDTYRDSLPLTGRQIFYRLVATEGYSKTENAYEALLEKLNRARRAGLIAMDDIRDDGAVAVGAERFTDGAEFLRSCRDWAASFELDLMRDQPRHVELFCEAAGMVPQLARIARPYGVAVRSSGGFDSTTVKHSLGRFYGGLRRPVVVLHVGDHDPSGEHIHKSLEEDLMAFAFHYGGTATVRRVAVTAEQQAFHGLPTAPPKATDRRSFSSDFTVQAEALPPDVLGQIVEGEILGQLDLGALQASQERQAEIRQDLLSRLHGVIDG